MPFQDLPDRLAAVRETIERARQRGGRGQEVRIVAVTKTYGPDAPMAAWQAGLRDVGENRVQEAVTKMAAVRADLRWHLIGHLQRNKVKQLDGFRLVHSMDSPRLADALAAYGDARGRPVDVLMQVNVSGEGSKGGYGPSSVEAEGERLHRLPGLIVRGVMTMAPFDAPAATLRSVFAGARRCAEQLSAAGHPATELSMGMSGDYEIAVEEGATLVRLGTVLFGARPA
ncbi:MAG: YggS family pyridoxal phosphate-dependent enzyme [Gemmatimonadaceae bacterium]|nr:YggS family pyridoxal phosphate-dependent enzyme [Gemmatimonadaceae bacterium]NUP71262.1 YggS family pyridoxal phosphate-dependent enzyme [Gemmatimonadaceae bacterium]NUS33376.1 YggS family pyridoxal phosphate-dependent enzyme [Gemmatimonadaceae bacterium]NUS47960.1 YggS family pyridoxal phosphate-dependent enzyme [Gemmatimonadaceae bacterium]